MDNKVTVLGVLFFVLCSGMIVGTTFLNQHLHEQQEQADSLRQMKVDLSASTRVLMEQKSVFVNVFKELENYRVNVADNDLAFFSDVQQVLQNNAMEILSTQQRGTDKDGLSSIAFTLRGDYYSLMQVLAAWRNLPITVRIATLTITSDSPPASGASVGVLGRVRADVTVEAIIPAAGGR